MIGQFKLNYMFVSRELQYCFCKCTLNTEDLNSIAVKWYNDSIGIVTCNLERQEANELITHIK